jgi:RNA polymerase sigma-70 factor, ECF subfamily
MPLPHAPAAAVISAEPTHDDTLARKLRDGDLIAFDGFVRAQWPRLVYYLADRVRLRDLAEDLAQEALARVWQHRQRLDPASSVVSYLYQTARNLAIDELRKVEVRRKWREQEQRLLFDPGEGVTPLQQVENREALDALRRALEALPQRRREAFLLVHVQQLSRGEAAEVMGNSPQTVANQVAAALVELRRALKAFVTDEE